MRYSAPVRRRPVSMSGASRSVSHTESTPCTSVRMRSKPAPVSIDGRGSRVREPSLAWLYCMKTRFQNSRNRSPAGSCSGPPSGPNALPRSMWISEHGPHGPTSPICQKLSLSPSRWMRSIGTPTTSCQICSASSSLSCTVIHNRSPSKPNTSVTSSQPHGMAFSLK